MSLRQNLSSSFFEGQSIIEKTCIVLMFKSYNKSFNQFGQFSHINFVSKSCTACNTGHSKSAMTSSQTNELHYIILICVHGTQQQCVYKYMHFLQTCYTVFSQLNAPAFISIFAWWTWCFFESAAYLGLSLFKKGSLLIFVFLGSRVSCS